MIAGLLALVLALPVALDGGADAGGVDAGLADAGPLTMTAAEVQADLAKRVAAVPKDTWTHVGRKPWLFRYFELRHYAQGPFWGADAAHAAVSHTDSDPLKAILAYDAMLRRVGVTLLVLPIPGKVLLYGDQLKPPIDSTALEPNRAEFLQVLRDHGVHVIDFLPDMKVIRDSGRLAYLTRDSHWSVESVHRAAQVLGRIIRGESWYRAPATKPVVVDTKATVQAYTDLATWRAMYQSNSIPVKEAIGVHRVQVNGEFTELDRQSPVLLVGDSSTLVFHSILVNEHSGLSDHLTAELGFPVDSEGLAGEEAVANSWIAVARRHDNLAGKKVVILCFGERSLTSMPHGWPIAPVVREPEPALPAR